MQQPQVQKRPSRRKNYRSEITQQQTDEFLKRPTQKIVDLDRKLRKSYEPNFFNRASFDDLKKLKQKGNEFEEQQQLNDQIDQNDSLFTVHNDKKTIRRRERQKLMKQLENSDQKQNQKISKNKGKVSQVKRSRAKGKSQIEKARVKQQQSQEDSNTSSSSDEGQSSNSNHSSESTSSKQQNSNKINQQIKQNATKMKEQTSALQKVVQRQLKTQQPKNNNNNNKNIEKYIAKQQQQNKIPPQYKYESPFPQPQVNSQQQFEDDDSQLSSSQHQRLSNSQQLIQPQKQPNTTNNHPNNHKQNTSTIIKSNLNDPKSQDQDRNEHQDIHLSVRKTRNKNLIEDKKNVIQQNKKLKNSNKAPNTNNINKSREKNGSNLSSNHKINVYPKIKKNQQKINQQKIQQIKEQKNHSQQKVMSSSKKDKSYDNSKSIQIKNQRNNYKKTRKQQKKAVTPPKPPQQLQTKTLKVQTNKIQKQQENDKPSVNQIPKIKIQNNLNTSIRQVQQQKYNNRNKKQLIVKKQDNVGQRQAKRQIQERLKQQNQSFRFIMKKNMLYPIKTQAKTVNLEFCPKNIVENFIFSTVKPTHLPTQQPPYYHPQEIAYPYPHPYPKYAHSNNHFYRMPIPSSNASYYNQNQLLLSPQYQAPLFRKKRIYEQLQSQDQEQIVNKYTFQKRNKNLQQPSEDYFQRRQRQKQDQVEQNKYYLTNLLKEQMSKKYNTNKSQNKKKTNSKYRLEHVGHYEQEKQEKQETQETQENKRKKGAVKYNKQIAQLINRSSGRLSKISKEERPRMTLGQRYHDQLSGQKRLLQYPIKRKIDRRRQKHF